MHFITLLNAYSYAPSITKPSSIDTINGTSILIDNIFYKNLISFLSSLIISGVSSHLPISVIRKNIFMSHSNTSPGRGIVIFKRLKSHTLSVFQAAWEESDFTATKENDDVNSPSLQFEDHCNNVLL